jgi:hypothetical protein|nr:MAG TPA: Protein of unknown function (DUF2570) [Caudoviricetes sp.]
MWFRIGLAAALIALGGGLWWHYTHTMAENKRLQAELSTANKTIAALDEAAKKHDAIRNKERDLIDEIDAAPAEADARTAPVLLDAIGRLQ